MRSDFKPDDDEGRVRALERLNVIDTAPEAPFENIVNLIQKILNVPICTISLVHRDRQWFKAKRGVETCETGRDVSFCTHTIQKTEPFIISDTHADPRFRNNPFVTGEPFIRSYVGIPLMVSEGYQIGSLCAIDTKPRNFTASEIALLQQFAKSVLSEFELRQIAATDHLTKALSRRGWQECAASQFRLAADDKLSISLAIIDIDRFNWINDRFGHAAGDQVLVALAELCMAEIRDDDFFGRLGGEEFGILFPDTDAATAEAITNRLRLAFENMEHQLSETVTATLSAGIAELHPDDNEFAAFLNRADCALYEAKRTGRNRVVTASAPRWNRSQGLVA